MLNLFANIRRCEKGDVVVEFAAAVPLLLILFFGLTEVGRAFLQANAIEKGMRVAAVYAARIENPTTTAAQNVIKNLAKTGTTDGSGTVLAEGWSDATSSLDIVQNFYTLNGDSVPVLSLKASVPFKPLIPELAKIIGMDNFTITLSHEQAYADH